MENYITYVLPKSLNSITILDRLEPDCVSPMVSDLGYIIQ